MHRRARFAALLLALMLPGCVRAASPTPTATPTREPSPTPHFPASDTPGPSPTVTPSETPTPTLIPTITPPLNPDGPWLVFGASDDQRVGPKLWVGNADGTGLRSMVSRGVLNFAVQPSASASHGPLVAYITHSGGDRHKMELNLGRLPDGQPETIASLIHDLPGQPPIDDFNAETAVEDGGLAWSPDGRSLAFVGQIDGPSMDVYRYDVDTQAVTRISSGDEQAFELRWSPNGQWVIHGAFQFVGMGGAGADEMWAARQDGSGSVDLFKGLRDQDGHIGDPYFYDWLNDAEVIIVDRSSKISAVNITSGEARTLVDGIFDSYTYSPEHDTWLVIPDTGGSAPPKLQLMQGNKAHDLEQPLDLINVWWSHDTNSFIGLDNTGTLFTISPEGNVAQMQVSVKDQSGVPFVISSPDGASWAWFADDPWTPSSSVWAGQAMQQPTQLLSGDFQNGVTPEDVAWSPDSKRLLMITNHGLWAAERPDFKPFQIAVNLHGSDSTGWGAVWVP